MANTTYNAGLPKLLLPRRVNLSDHAKTLVDKHGSLRATSRVLQIDAGYLSRIISGEKTNLGVKLMRKMGLTKTTIYEVWE